MLYGNKDEVISILKEALYKATFVAWDVVKPSPCNTTAQEQLKIVSNEAIKAVEPSISVSPSQYPLHGKPELRKLPIEILNEVVKAYGKPVLPKKQAEILKVFKANVELSFNSVPQTKKDLQDKYPELFPQKRQRKKRNT